MTEGLLIGGKQAESGSKRRRHLPPLLSSPTLAPNGPNEARSRRVSQPLEQRAGWRAGEGGSRWD